MRIFTISDIHIDFEENRRWLQQELQADYSRDALILAGDVAHDLDLLGRTFKTLVAAFAHVFFVPGNHDLWLHNGQWTDSLAKFEDLLKVCASSGVSSAPRLLGQDDKNPVWVVPLYSWYTQPGEGNDDLYLDKPGEDPANRMWSDNYYIRWPQNIQRFKASAHFAGLNKPLSETTAVRSVISFSHFLPRREVMIGRNVKPDPELIKKFDRNPQFNFSRVAGSSLIEEQLRALGARIHVYGHQHINRDKTIDGVRYISHCLGYPAERRRGMVLGVENGFKLIWNTEKK